MDRIPDVLFDQKTLAEQAVLAIADKAAEKAAAIAAREAANLAAERTADKVVERLSLIFGIDLADHDEIVILRRKMAFLRQLEQGSRDVKSVALKTAIGSLVAAVIALLLLGFTEWLKSHH